MNDVKSNGKCEESQCSPLRLVHLPLVYINFIPFIAARELLCGLGRVNRAYAKWCGKSDIIWKNYLSDDFPDGSQKRKVIFSLTNIPSDGCWVMIYHIKYITNQHKTKLQRMNIAVETMNRDMDQLLGR